MPLKPLGKRILVEPYEDIKEVGGILLPDYAVEKQHEGIVRALGKFKENEDVPKEGERVYYRQGYGSEVMLNNKLHVLLAIEDVLGVVS